MQIRLHDVEGQTLRVGIRRGEKARPPLLLFNGIGANIELVEPFLDALDGPEAIIFDVPGVGGSPSPWLPYRPSNLTRLSARLLDQLGHHQVDVLGVSWGGALAQQFAFQQGKRCRRLVLAATSPGHLMVPGKLTVLLKMATPRRYKDPYYMKRIAGDIYGGALRASPELVRKHLRHVRWSSDYGYYLQLLAGFGWTSLPWLRLLAQPTLVMAGTDDPLVPVANGRILASLIPDARLVTIDDGHLFLVTSASQSAAMISEFLS
ncbi:MAG: poly(3-hydroxyalkanoate) depolymerase [Hyphomicrobiales bacterium]|jgi:poly(3-hydroxyalkanoate) depolymerase|nr:poly(3-hydroxyalkanoate) depolymerase [Xanthobacteraceae bacterium]